MRQEVILPMPHKGGTVVGHDETWEDTFFGLGMEGFKPGFCPEFHRHPAANPGIFQRDGRTAERRGDQHLIHEFIPASDKNSGLFRCQSLS